MSEPAKQSKPATRNYPKHTLQEVLVVPQRIQDEMEGKPYNRLLLAESLKIKPASTNFRDLLNSSSKYGFTKVTNGADEVALTSAGDQATRSPGL